LLTRGFKKKVELEL